ncbi:MAG: helix-turn-helix domain-containing protein, partial [Candidatus Odinarchaeota archaeon]
VPKYYEFVVLANEQPNNVAKRIKELRNRKGLSQEELSEKMSINTKYLSGIERGKENPTLNTFIKLSEALDVEIGEIFKFIEAGDIKANRSAITSLLKDADEEKQKLIYKIIYSIVR